MQCGRRREIFCAGDVERPQRRRRTQAIAARDRPIELPVSRIEIGAARNGPAIAQCRISEGGHDLCEHHRWGWCQVIRNQLLKQIAREFGKLMLKLELDPSCQKRRSFEQAGDHRVHALGEQAPETFRDSGILDRELPRLLVQNLELAIVEIEKFAVHPTYPCLIVILALSSSTSATNSMGTLTGSQTRSACMMKRTLSAAVSRLVSRETLTVVATNRGS